MEPKIVNANPRWPVPALRTPLPYGYLYLGATVAPPPQPGPPLPRRSARRTALLGRLKSLATELERLEPVRQVTVFRAVMVPPVQDDTDRPVHPARFDVALLIETVTPETTKDVQASESYRRLVYAVDEAASSRHVMAARCGRLIGDVDRTRPGLFLFNHFTTERPQVALELWEHLAGWYLAETGLDNSTLLEPIGDADYVFVNHARWDVSLPRLAMEQFVKPSFRSYVLANLRANRTVAMPVLYRLA
ncbi:MAG: hypothetical protein ACREQM_05240 [Candidatus Dormibacteraceae bacterium]